MLLGGVQALAEPLHFVCDGKNYFVTGPQQARTVEDTVSVTLEWDEVHSTSPLQFGRAHVGGWEAVLLTEPGENRLDGGSGSEFETLDTPFTPGKFSEQLFTRSAGADERLWQARKDAEIKI
jgi:hypothetical protein